MDSNVRELILPHVFLSWSESGERVAVSRTGSIKVLKIEIEKA